MNVLDDIKRRERRETGQSKRPSRFYVGVMTGLFTEKHLRKMGAAVYTYGFLLSKVTGWDDRYNLGAVLKGAPVKYEFIAEETGIHDRTIRRHIMTLEENGYIIKLRHPRGLKLYITNYRPAGKPNLKTGECPHLAIQVLTDLSKKGLQSGHTLATHEGINEFGNKTETVDLKHVDNLQFQCHADFYYLLLDLFGIELGTGELRYLFRGDKHTKTFCGERTVLTAVARTLMRHESKQASQLKRGLEPVGITNIVAYLNAGLHGPHRYLLQPLKNEIPVVERVHARHREICAAIEQRREQIRRQQSQPQSKGDDS